MNTFNISKQARTVYVLAVAQVALIYGTEIDELNINNLDVQSKIHNIMGSNGIALDEADCVIQHYSECDIKVILRARE